MLKANNAWMLVPLAVSLLTLAACSSSNETTQSSLDLAGTDFGMTSTEQPASNPAENEDGASPDDAGTDFNLNDVSYQLIEQLGGYPLILTAKQIVAISDFATGTAIDSIELDSIDLTVEVQEDTQSVPFERIQYSCEQGGQMIVRKAVIFQSSASHSQSFDHAEYIFDQCQLFTGGAQVLNGSMRVIDEIVFDIFENSVDRSVVWTDFSWEKENSSKLAINAEIQLLNSEAIITSSSREVNISSYEFSVDNQLQEAVYGAAFLLTTNSINEGNIQEYSLSVSGQAIGPSRVSVTVSTDPILQRKLVSEGVEVDEIPFNGSIIMQADDQSMVTLTANAQSTENNTLQVDKTYTSADGIVTTLEAQNFVDLPILAF